MRIYDSFEQRSDEWYEVRMGVITASQFKRVMGGRGGDLTYMSELMSQKLTNRSKEMYMSDAMEHGVETEKQAVCAYEFMNNVNATEVAFVKKDAFIGASPDALIGKDGMLEIKCPDTHTHIKWKMSGTIPKEHFHQVIGSLWVTGRKWADFMSFCPYLDPPHDTLIIRVYKKDVKEEIDLLRSKIMSFKEKMVGSLKTFE